CKELQIEVDSFEQAELLLVALGLKIFHCWEKYRTSYALESLKIEIDEFPGVPPFLEIEGEKSEIERIIGLLGFSMNDTTNMHGGQVLKKYGKQSADLKF
ncbi:MAG: hypothetical protein ACP5N3_01955, partial [Candidatus Nanoarchaeia archaeon]